MWYLKKCWKKYTLNPVKPGEKSNVLIIPISLLKRGKVIARSILSSTQILKVKSRSQIQDTTIISIYIPIGQKPNQNKKPTKQKSFKCFYI